MKQTALCQLLGIDYPIIQAAMGWICGADLAAAVSNAGGLGILGTNAGLKEPPADPEQSKKAQRLQIQKTRELTGKTFGMNIGCGPKIYLNFADKYVELAIEEKLPVVVVSGGSAEIYTRRLKDAGIKVIHAVATIEQAQKAEEVGVDAVIAQGYDGGGHLGVDEIPTFVLVPQIVDAVRIPVIAGGGIADGRGMAAAFALGAQGVYIGTRFIATPECDAHPDMKEAIVRAGDTGTVVIGRRLDSALMRQLKNEFSQEYLEKEYSGASREALRDFVAGRPRPGRSRYTLAYIKGDLENGFTACSTDAGLIKEIISAGEIVRRIVSEADSVAAQLNGVFNGK